MFSSNEIVTSNVHDKSCKDYKSPTGPARTVYHSAGHGCLPHRSWVVGLGFLQWLSLISTSVPSESSTQNTWRDLAPCVPSLQLFEHSVHGPMLHLRDKRVRIPCAHNLPPPELKKTQQQQQGLSAVRMEFQRGQGTRKRSHSSPRLPLHQQFKMASQNYTNNLKDASMTIQYLIYSLIIVTITNKHVFVITHCVLTLEGMTACYIFCAGPQASFPYRTDHQLAIHRPHEHIQQWEPPFLWQNK